MVKNQNLLKLKRLRSRASKQYSNVSSDSAALGPITAHDASLIKNMRLGVAGGAKRRQATTMYFELLRDYFNSIIRFLHKQSYLLSLISMMAWSILYHSILTLVLLIWACVIWVMPKSRVWCLRSSPLFVFYSIGLFLLEFVYGFDLELELPQFKELGLVRHDVAIFHLALKTGLITFLLLTLKQFITERKEQIRRAGGLQLVSDIHDVNFMQPQIDEENVLHIFQNREDGFTKSYIQSTVSSWFHMFLIKYWIFLSSLTLLLMSCQNDVVAYRIGYMVLFLYFITTFQVIFFDKL